MAERRAAAAARIKAMTVETKPAKPRLRVHAGGIVTDLMLKIALGIETAAQKFAIWAEAKAEQHVAGNKCPHCSGTGRYRLHTQPGSNNKCYRCDGKGVLNNRDLAFLDRRMKGAGPICWVITAPAA
jgi:hypothetical protein